MWVLGDGNLGLDDLVLVRVENVSKGSWQPQFLVDRQRRNLVQMTPARPRSSFGGQYD